MNQEQYFIGLISGTSIDGLDCLLADFSTTPPTVVGTHNEPINQQLRDKILYLCENEGASIQLAGEVDIELGRSFAAALNALLATTGIKSDQVMAIGSHGQTVNHQPNSTFPFTMQLGDPNSIAELTGITTIADFRRRDMVVGGQGAPLTPMFHEFFFRSKHTTRIILNIGGMSNISVLYQDSNQSILGFDTGPGNVLMDSWINENQGKSFDAQGEWGKSGTLDMELLSIFMAEPYFQRPAPKSTGRELFNLGWLKEQINKLDRELPPCDVQATLVELTVRSLSDNIRDINEPGADIYVCGGGVHNSALLERLQDLLSDYQVQKTDAAALPADWVEAMAFAWMAKQTLERKPIDCTSVTGASKPCILGGIYYS